MTTRRKAIAAIATQKVESTENYLEHAGEDIYGSYVFGEEAQREYLAKPVYRQLRPTIAGLQPFDASIADARQQVRVPRGWLVSADLLATDRAQHHRG
jgi:glutamine synthetase type III